ncbi:hypothetical protein D3C87_1469840 [compost metagenome]
MIDTTGCRLADRIRHIRVGGDKGVCRAERTCQRQLVLGEIDRDDPLRARHDRSEHCRKPDPAEADDGHRLACLDAAGIDDRADAGQHGAAEKRRLDQRQIAVHLDGRMARHDRMVGKP